MSSILREMNVPSHSWSGLSVSPLLHYLRDRGRFFGMAMALGSLLAHPCRYLGPGHWVSWRPLPPHSAGAAAVEQGRRDGIPGRVYRSLHRPPDLSGGKSSLLPRGRPLPLVHKLRNIRLDHYWHQGQKDQAVRWRTGEHCARVAEEINLHSEGERDSEGFYEQSMVLF